ncbi:hypothetical protein P7C70_g7468, partial [Phenoliferia sp. Uapishka_3]
MLAATRRTTLHSGRTSLHRSNLSTAARPARSSNAPIVLAASATTLIIAGLYFDRKPLQQDSGAPDSGYESQSQLHKGQLGSIRPSVFMWGRNSYNVVAPSAPESDIVKKAKVVVPFDGMVLRDLVLHEKYGLAVDAKGDVLQWGLGFDPTSPQTGSDSAAPHVALRNRDILSVVASEAKIYALNRKGEVLVFPSELEKQQVGAEARASGDAWWKMGWAFGSGNPGCDVEKLKSDVKLASGEKFVSISCGNDHLLAVTSAGRSFASPINLAANRYGQLGVRRVTLLSIHPSSVASGGQHVQLIPDAGLNERRNILPPPPKRLDPLLLPMNNSVPVMAPQLELDPVVAPPPSFDIRLHEEEEQHTALENDIRFSTTLHEIPALQDLPIAELVAGSKHSVARTTDGRVLGFGSNDYGQLGLGPSLAIPSIATPTEIPLQRNYPRATRVICKRVAAGGSITYFVVEREEIGSGKLYVDLLATGNGQFGGMGNGTWAHSASPVKVKTVSGLLEWSDKEQKIAAIPIRTISVGRTHVAIVLDNAVDQGRLKFGRDVFVLGQNEFYQLGTGKRSNLSSPQHLPPLPYTGLTAAPTSEEADKLVSSGTLSPMPHSRLQLAPEIKVDGKRVEETITAGDSATAVYWRILDP